MVIPRRAKSPILKEANRRYSKDITPSNRVRRFSKDLTPSCLKVIKEASSTYSFSKIPYPDSMRTDIWKKDDEYDKHYEHFFYDQFGNYKKIEQKKGEIVNQIETNNFQIDLQSLQNNQQQMGLSSLLHLNYLKQSKKRAGQLNGFRLLEKDVEDRIRLEDVKKKKESQTLAESRLNTMHSMSMVKLDKARATAAEQLIDLKARSKEPLYSFRGHDIERLRMFYGAGSKRYISKLLNRFLNIIKKIAKKLIYFDLSFEQACKSTIVSSKAYFSNNSKEFFMLLKKGRVDQILDLIDKNRMLIFDYTHVECE